MPLEKKYFQYTTEQLNYIKEKDVLLKSIINKYGLVKRQLQDTPFYALAYAIIGQLISTKTANNIFNKFIETYKDHHDVLKVDVLEIKSLGLTLRRAQWLYDICLKIGDGSLDLNNMATLDEKEAIKILTSLPGIGIWSAKIILLFGFNKMNISIYEDLGLRISLTNLYNVNDISKKEFNAIMNKFSPYQSVASLYLWRHYHDLTIKKENS